MTVRWGHCISNSFNVTNGVRQGAVFFPQLFNVYIDGLSDILNKSTIGVSLDGKRINHLLYADNLYNRKFTFCSSTTVTVNL